MTRTEAKAYIDKKVIDHMNATNPSPNNHFSANLIEKERWTKKECDQTAEECIGYVNHRAKRHAKFLRADKAEADREKKIPSEIPGLPIREGDEL